jgi:hypothetical protein
MFGGDQLSRFELRYERTRILLVFRKGDFLTTLTCSASCWSSDALVWVHHDSDGGSHSSGSDVASELDSHGTSMSVGVDNLTPAASVSGVVNSVFDLVNVGDSLAEVPFGTSLVVTVHDADKSLITVGSLSISFVSSENSLDIKSDWLSLVVDLLLGGFNFFSHCFSL